MHLTGGEELPPGVAVSHRVEQSGIGFVDQTVQISILNVVIDVVGGLTHSFEIIPKQTVLNWGGFDEVGAAKQGQFFLQKGGHLVFKSEHS